MTPSWLLDIFAALMLAVTAVSLARLTAARAWVKLPARADIDAAHLLMGIAMAGMLASGLRTFPNVGWEVIFAVLAIDSAIAVARARHRELISSLEHDSLPFRQLPKRTIAPETDFVSTRIIVPW